MGTIMLGEPDKYRDIFDFDNFMEDSLRIQKLENLFTDYIVPTTERVLTQETLKEFIREEEIFVLPAVKKELGL